MFNKYNISRNYVWNHEEVHNQQLVDEVKAYMNVLAEYADGD